jgi:hypothetical protein
VPKINKYKFKIPELIWYSFATITSIPDGEDYTLKQGCNNKKPQQVEALKGGTVLLLLRGVIQFLVYH